MGYRRQRDQYEQHFPASQAAAAAVVVVVVKFVVVVVVVMVFVVVMLLCFIRMCGCFSVCFPGMVVQWLHLCVC